MSGLNLFIIGVVLILALALWNWRHLQENRQALEQVGFHIDERFGGSPELVLDTQRRELALISGRGYERFPLSELLTAELAWDSRRESEVNYRVELQLRDKRLLKVGYPNEWEAREALKRVLALTAN